MPKAGAGFRMYIAATNRTLGAVLTQELVGKEYAMAYLSKWMLDTETRYTHVERLCLSLYYACLKCRHYILSSSCVLTCQHNVVKHMIQKLVLSGRLGKWAYALVEYELTYEPLKAVKGQILADFIINHGIANDDVCLVMKNLWRLYFIGSVCAQGNGISCVIVSPRGTTTKYVYSISW
jgi:hypothetical protein